MTSGGSRRFGKLGQFLAQFNSDSLVGTYTLNPAKFFRFLPRCEKPNGAGIHKII
jgi:hypothetical protein